MEIVAHCVANALFYSKQIRSRTVIHIVLDGPGDPPKTLRFESETLGTLEGSDERGICSVIKTLLGEGQGLSLGQEKEVDHGLFVSKKGFEPLVKEKCACSVPYLLKPDGTDIRTISFDAHPIFVFSDHLAMPKKSDKYLQRLGLQSMSVGPKTLFASQCIVLVHNELDRQGVA